MSGYVTNALNTFSSAFDSFSRIPLSDSIYSGMTQAANYIRPDGALEKVFTHVPLRALGFVGTQFALVGMTLKCAQQAYNSESKKAKLFYGTAAFASSVLICIEILKFDDIASCFNGFDCTSIYRQVCAAKAQAAYNSCIGN